MSSFTYSLSQRDPCFDIFLWWTLTLEVDIDIRKEEGGWVWYWCVAVLCVAVLCVAVLCVAVLCYWDGAERSGMNEGKESGAARRNTVYNECVREWVGNEDILSLS